MIAPDGIGSIRSSSILAIGTLVSSASGRENRPLPSLALGTNASAAFGSGGVSDFTDLLEPNQFYGFTRESRQLPQAVRVSMAMIRTDRDFCMDPLLFTRIQTMG